MERGRAIIETYNVHQPGTMKITKTLFKTHLDHVIKVLHARLPVDPQIHRHVFILDELCSEHHAVEG